MRGEKEILRGKSMKVESILNEYMEHERRRGASEKSGASERRGASGMRGESGMRSISEEEEYQEVEDKQRSHRHRYIYENIMKSFTLC